MLQYTYLPVKRLQCTTGKGQIVPAEEQNQIARLFVRWQILDHLLQKPKKQPFKNLQSATFEGETEAGRE